MVKALHGVFTSLRTNLFQFSTGISSIQTSGTSLFFYPMSLFFFFSKHISNAQANQTCFLSVRCSFFWLKQNSPRCLLLSFLSTTAGWGNMQLFKYSAFSEHKCNILFRISWKICLLSDRKTTQNLKVKYLWICYFFLQQIIIMKYTFSFFGAVWKRIIGEIKYCAFKMYFI